jgi:hypothetical protein
MVVGVVDNDIDVAIVVNVGIGMMNYIVVVGVYVIVGGVVAVF